MNAKARLWLRGERAFGLQWLPVRIDARSDSGIAGSDGEQREAKLATTPQATRTRSDAPLAKPAAATMQRSIAPVQLEVVKTAASTAHLSSEDGPFTSKVLSRAEKAKALAELNENEVAACQKCRLGASRTQTVFGEGDPDAKIFFIGEGPGENEDLTGRPFVGRAGHLLDKMIAGMGLKREDVYIANIVKCRPPQNRAPVPDETDACTPYLVRQLEIVRPKVIVTLGLPAAKYMLRSASTMSRLRGNWHAWRGIKLMPTFHPAYLLRSYTRENREAVWSDLQKVMAEVGLKVVKKFPSEASDA